MPKTSDKPASSRKTSKDITSLGDELGGYKPPQATDIEEAVLGALLLEPNVVPDVLDQLTEECFYKQSHRTIFRAITKLAQRNDPIDIFTVSDQLEKEDSLEEVGGRAFLTRLSLKIGAAAHVDYHTKVILQKWIQRELIFITHEAQKIAFDDSLPVDDLIDNVQNKIFALSEKNMKKETSPIQTVIAKAVKEITENQKRTDNLSGVPSGYRGIDEITYGWQKSDLIIIAARPSVGKTAFVLTMARNMAIDHHVPVALFSLEMSDVQLVKRLLVSEIGITPEQMNGVKKFNSMDDWKALTERLVQLENAPLWIDDTPSLSIYEFRSKARRLVKNNKVQIIIIDYLQLMTGPPELRGQREQEVSTISRQLKAIAKDLEIPIIALSQLNRQVETRGGNKRPQLSDLRESGAIEQDADIVMFIHRPEKYGITEETSFPGETDIIIAKHRNGQVCDVKMRFLGSEVRFVDVNDGASYINTESTSSSDDGDYQYTDSVLGATMDIPDENESI